MSVQCAICTDSYSSEKITSSTACGHVYHHDCLVEWLQKSPICPLCSEQCEESSLKRIYLDVFEPSLSMADFDAQNMEIGKLKSLLDDLNKKVDEEKEHNLILHAENCSQKEKLNELMIQLQSIEDASALPQEQRNTIDSDDKSLNIDFKCQLYYMKLADQTEENEVMPFLCDWVLHHGASVGETKRQILEHIATVDPKYDIPYERCRLRKKNANCPSKIYMDDQTFGDDVALIENSQIIVQELDDSTQQITDPEAITVILRRWNPAQMTLGPFQELTINTNDEIKSLIATLSVIPEENIEYAKVGRFFPRSPVSLLDVHISLPWTSNKTPNHVFRLSNRNDGNVYYYRDKTEELKNVPSNEPPDVDDQST